MYFFCCLRLTYDRTLQNDPAQTTEEGPEGQNPVSAQPAAIKVSKPGTASANLAKIQLQKSKQ